MSRILGIDYGDVRVGLAISDELNITAQGLDTLVINNSTKKLINHIKNLIKEYGITTIVFGYPKNMNGTMSDKTIKVDEIISLLKDKVDIEIVKWDERLTTVTANNVLISGNVSRKNRKKVVDSVAATIILQGYLDRSGKR